MRSKKSAAFTLAEVLLVLTIIGVVSSLTVPTLMKNTQQSTFNTSVVNIMNTIATAIQSIQASGGLIHTGITGSTNSMLANDFCNVMACVGSPIVAIGGSSAYNYYRGGTLSTALGTTTDKLLANGVTLSFQAITTITAVGSYGTTCSAYPGCLVGYIYADAGNGPNMVGRRFVSV